MSNREFLTVIVGKQEFGIPVLDVHDVLRAQATTKVALAAPEVAGVLNLRGRIVTAVDLRTRLGLKPRAAGETSMYVVVHHKGEPYGLVCDSVGDVIALADEDCEPPPANLDGVWTSLSTGVYRLKGRLLLVLDVSGAIDGSRKRAA